MYSKAFLPWSRNLISNSSHLQSVIQLPIEYECVNRFYSNWLYKFPIEFLNFFFQSFTCFFNRLYGFESKIANGLAGFLAGGFFYFYPQLSFLSYGLACTIEIVWQRFRKHKHRRFAIIRRIDQLPLARIFYPILMGYLFHMRSFYPWQVPTLLHKVMAFVTCKQ